MIRDPESISILTRPFRRRFARLVGRGTTALFLALRAFDSGEIILPDLICSTVLDAVLLAGMTPVFADVTSDRFTIDPVSIARKITPHTRAILAAHLFGHVMDVAALRRFGIPIIEDAVQGLGGYFEGQPVGTLGDISFTSFHPTKMIGGYGGLVGTDDPVLWKAIQRTDFTVPAPPTDEGERFRHYRPQLEAMRVSLLRPFDSSADNIAAIRAGWLHLPQNVQARREKAQYLRANLAGVFTPEIWSGDVPWRYTIAAPDRASAAWLRRKLQQAGLGGSALYPSLANLYAPDPSLRSIEIVPRLINLWVDAETTQASLNRVIVISQSRPPLPQARR